MILYIVADRRNGVVWQLVLNYMWTPPTLYYLESNGQVAYMETHPKNFIGFRAINSRTSMLYNI